MPAFDDTNLPQIFRNTKWMTIPHSIEKGRGKVQGPAVTIGDNKLAILVARGAVPLLDLRTNELTQLPPMPAPFRRFGYCAVAMKDRVYVFGGCGEEVGKVLDTVDMLDLRASKWTRVGKMPTPLEGCAATVVDDDRIALVGGQTRDNSSRADKCFLFHVGDNSWSEMPNMHKARYLCAASVVDGNLYAIGGYGKDTVEMFNFSAKEWTLLSAPMKERRAGCAAVVVGKYIIVMGGNSGIETHKSVEAFNASTQTWSDLPDMSMGRMPCSAALAGNRIVVLGGWCECIEPSETMEMMAIDPYYLTVPKLVPLLRQDDLPLGLWSHVVAKCQPSAVYSVLTSGRLAVDSVLLKQKNRNS